ncbi:DUF3445 domain-containing protein [Thalassococcus sp. S3]|uniref:heme-dependent oxidative N-demethylase family protein n=1 Tax=Thalassococcus sp. S3 TaxID=2017482 RepID=UPI0010245025|nr:DUF3445 domain-containing protein [Thalassococcus sp. S3]QBF32706.1 hypothetical protein CFI11_16005 [Thalassococcus sp. S3]
MVVILQRELPQDMRVHRALPGVAPLPAEGWITVDDAFAAQMARREILLREQREEVLFLDEAARPAAQELLETVLALLPGLGFQVDDRRVTRPDGGVVEVSPSDPLGTLGHLVQEDLCLMEKRGAEHVLTGAVLCFPASWRLAEKAMRPLISIHEEVQDYDEDIARRVQRLFDGVRVGRPLWRFNRLWYADPELYQPRSAVEPRRIEAGATDAPFLRSERQSIVRLPQSGAVIFAIHTYVLAAEDVPE